MIIDEELMIRKINESNAKKVMIQVPEGLKLKINHLVEEIKTKTDAEPVVWLEPCFGACDLADEKALFFDCDLLIHFGHSKMYSSKIETLFIPIKYKVDLSVTLNKLAEKLKEDNQGWSKNLTVGIVSAVQYLGYFDEIISFLKQQNIKAVIGTPDQKRVHETGQVLGCNFSAMHSIEKECDAFIYFGDGLFHPLGLAFSSEKRVYIADPIASEVREIINEKDLFLRKRYGLIAKADSAEVFGIIVTSKKGQYRKQSLENTISLLQKHEKDYIILAADFISQQKLLGIKIDALVNTACPRIAIDDAHLYEKPMLTPSELEIMLEKKPIEDYRFDEF